MTSGGEGMGDLDVWLTPFLDVMSRKTRRAWAPFYKGLAWAWRAQEPATHGGAARLARAQTVAALHRHTAWNDGPLWTVLGREADRLVGGADAYWNWTRFRGYPETFARGVSDGENPSAVFA